MTVHARHLAWTSAASALGATGIVAVAGVSLGEYEAGFWRAVSALVIVLTASCAAFAGLELLHRRQLVPLGWWVLLTAPLEAGALLAANWQEHVSDLHKSTLITCATLLLSGLVVSSLWLLVDARVAAALAVFWTMAATTLAVDVLALVVTWRRATPDPATSVMLALIAATIVLFALAPLVQRRYRPRDRR
jgi:hypothetical protein